MLDAAHLWEIDTNTPIPSRLRFSRQDVDGSPKGQGLFDAARYRVYDLAHHDYAAARDLTCIQAIVDEEDTA